MLIQPPTHGCANRPWLTTKSQPLPYTAAFQANDTKLYLTDVQSIGLPNPEPPAGGFDFTGTEPISVKSLVEIDINVLYDEKKWILYHSRAVLESDDGGHVQCNDLVKVGFDNYQPRNFIFPGFKKPVRFSSEERTMTVAKLKTRICQMSFVQHDTNLQKAILSILDYFFTL